MIGERSIKIGVASATAMAAGTTLATAGDWTGPYAGISVNSNSGKTPITIDGYSDYKLDKSPVAGAFAGMRWEAGAAVIGVELALQGKINGDANDEASGDYDFNQLIDAKVSVGVPVGKALVYGFAGVSAGVVSAWGEDYNATGMNLGAGVDYKVTDKMSVGLEYISRNMNGYNSGGSGGNYSPAKSMSLRASFHF